MSFLSILPVLSIFGQEYNNQTVSHDQRNRSLRLFTRRQKTDQDIRRQTTSTFSSLASLSLFHHCWTLCLVRQSTRLSTTPTRPSLVYSERTSRQRWPNTQTKTAQRPRGTAIPGLHTGTVTTGNVIGPTRHIVWSAYSCCYRCRCCFTEHTTTGSPRVDKRLKWLAVGQRSATTKGLVSVRIFCQENPKPLADRRRATMPSIIQRMRRGSETTNRPEQTGSPGKRLSIDVSQMDHSEAPKSGKLKGLFGKHDEGGGGDGPNKLDSLKKKLTSPSTIFKHQPSEGLDNRPITPPQDQEISDPTLARYAAAAPLTPPRAVNGSPRFPSPATSPQQFSLSRSRSPENGSHRNSWTPSYPLVVPDDGYADIAPDGHAVSPPKNTAPIAGSNENSRRRSMQLDAPPRTLDDIQPIQPDRPKVTAKISPDSGLPTPPTSSDSRDTIPTAERPSLSLETDLAKPAPATETSAASSEATPLAAPFSPTPTSPTLATPASPTSADPSRPAKPVRQRTNLITSPPMPQPIKNLPTLAGWSGISNQPFAASPTTPRTPGWGALAREGGPKTPGGMMSPRTPGANGGGFPFIRQPLPRQTSKGPMSDGELRKAKRAMVRASLFSDLDASADTIHSL